MPKQNRTAALRLKLSISNTSGKERAYQAINGACQCPVNNETISLDRNNNINDSNILTPVMALIRLILILRHICPMRHPIVISPTDDLFKSSAALQFYKTKKGSSSLLMPALFCF